MSNGLFDLDKELNQQERIRNSMNYSEYEKFNNDFEMSGLTCLGGVLSNSSMDIQQSCVTFNTLNDATLYYDKISNNYYLDIESHKDLISLLNTLNQIKEQIEILIEKKN